MSAKILSTWIECSTISKHTVRSGSGWSKLANWAKLTRGGLICSSWRGRFSCFTVCNRTFSDIATNGEICCRTQITVLCESCSGFACHIPCVHKSPDDFIHVNVVFLTDLLGIHWKSISWTFPASICLCYKAHNSGFPTGRVEVNWCRQGRWRSIRTYIN